MARILAAGSGSWLAVTVWWTMTRVMGANRGEPRRSDSSAPHSDLDTMGGAATGVATSRRRPRSTAEGQPGVTRPTASAGAHQALPEHLPAVQSPPVGPSRSATGHPGRTRRRGGPSSPMQMVIPILTPEEMRAADAAAADPVEVLVTRAGGAVARGAVELLGGTYGRRVVVVAGKGNNGADGREAARRLRRRGVRVTVVDAAAGPRSAGLRPGDRRRLRHRLPGRVAPPDTGGAPVLAVDIPTGVDGRTGEAGAGVLAAVRTVTFAALKPGLVLGRGPEPGRRGPGGRHRRRRRGGRRPTW